MHCPQWGTVEECVFTVRTFYQTSSSVAVKRQFQKKFYRQKAPATSAISCLVQKSEVTGSICDNKERVVEDTSQHTHRILLLMYVKCHFRVQENLLHYIPSHMVIIRTHTIMQWVTMYPFKM